MKLVKTHLKKEYNFHFNQNWALFKLINASFWRSGEKWFMSFVFTALFIVIFGYINQAILVSNNSQELVPAQGFKDALTGLAALMVISTGLNSMPVSIMEIKESVLMKRIGSTPIKPWMFITTIAAFYILIMIAQILLVLFVIFIFFGFQTFGAGSILNPIQITGNQLFFTGYHANGLDISTNWGGYIFGTIYTILLSIFLAILIVSLTKKSASASMVGGMIYFLSMFLSGLLFPLAVISNNNILYGLSFISPFRYVNVLITLSWNGFNIFNLAEISEKITQFNGNLFGIKDIAEVWTGYFVPVIFIGLAIFFSIRRFRWSTR
ncbi:ABC transporter permease [Mycoplasmoides pirum]|uniref:ABC transporter permease n=1 Tax=Mycoplasmoides pirum TaxID=2122 RepID=UPI0004863B3F|nr:ABC transporter permease [Mycoplasmoides pirum]